MGDSPLHIVILAAGKGSRMRSSIPKVLHQLAGKSLLEHVIESAATLNPEQIHVVIGHGKERVKDSFQNHHQIAKLNWVEQIEQLGTGHAVMQAIPAISNDSTVLMLTADVPMIRADTLSAMVNAMSTHSIALLTAIVDDPKGLGRITRDLTGSVNGIIEEKDADDEQRKLCEINSGIICARKKELGTWLNDINNTNAQREYYLTDIVGLAYQAGYSVAVSHPTDNFEVAGINSRSQLATVERIYQRAQAERLMANGVTIIDPERVDIRGEVEIGQDSFIDANVVIEGPTTIGENVHIAPNCVITASTLDNNVNVHANTVIDHAELGNGANVGPFARLRPGTKLSANVKIGNFVETKNAQLSEDVKVNHLSYVGDATIGRDTNIGAGVITVNYDGANKHQTTIGDGVFVGSNSELVAPIEIADGATVGAGSTITRNVDKNQLAVGRARQRQIDGWQRPSKPKK